MSVAFIGFLKYSIAAFVVVVCLFAGASISISLSYLFFFFNLFFQFLKSVNFLSLDLILKKYHTRLIFYIKKENKLEPSIKKNLF